MSTFLMAVASFRFLYTDWYQKNGQDDGLSTPFVHSNLLKFCVLMRNPKVFSKIMVLSIAYGRAIYEWDAQTAIHLDDGYDELLQELLIRPKLHTLIVDVPGSSVIVPSSLTNLTVLWSPPDYSILKIIEAASQLEILVIMDLRNTCEMGATEVLPIINYPWNSLRELQFGTYADVSLSHLAESFNNWKTTFPLQKVALQELSLVTEDPVEEDEIVEFWTPSQGYR
ncbi:hypothetical protein M422DRAFT_242758 [Sphaerobolus stellatus SS14]|nr:hypothetical protein M422DRAFT_242758 [Sphaerobolus stellatus SS14]